MLKYLELNLFKCFEKICLELKPLTLLAGSNASGKSSIFQALLLLHQTMKESEWSEKLMLNGGSIQLGTVSDVVDKVYGRKNFQVKVKDELIFIKWDFIGERNDMSMAVSQVDIDGLKINNPSKMRYLLPLENHEFYFNCLLNLTYITAERVGPRQIYDLKDQMTATVVGPAGEYASSILYWGRDEKVLTELALDGVPNTRFRQVEGYMKKFFPGCSLALNQVTGTNSITLGLRTSDDTNYHRPVHVGFGLTQIFPIIVAALSAKKNDILLIENPEVHLHPAGQSLIGIFLAKVADAGIQVLVETHSDHVLNGIRRCVKSKNLSSDKVGIYFLKSRNGSDEQAISINLNENGDLDYWPDGFFDQFDKDMDYFAGWGE